MKAAHDERNCDCCKGKLFGLIKLEMIGSKSRFTLLSIRKSIIVAKPRLFIRLYGEFKKKFYALNK
jgi:hypothetical protein